MGKLLNYKLLVIVCLLIAPMSVLQVSCSTKPEETKKDEDSFPNLVQYIRKSLAIVQVGTNHVRLAKCGTAFILNSIEDTTFLASTYHTFFEPSEHFDTTLDSTIILTPDTSKISVRFEVDDAFRGAKLAVTRKDRDVAILKLFVPADSLIHLGTQSTVAGNVNMIREGASVASTGYSFLQKTVHFKQPQYWPITYKGIISSVRDIGPSTNELFVHQFLVDMSLGKGASGSPVYRVSDGKVLGMFNRFKAIEMKGKAIPFGLGYCIPTWVIVNCFREYINERESQDTINIE